MNSNCQNVETALMGTPKVYDDTHLRKRVKCLTSAQLLCFVIAVAGLGTAIIVLLKFGGLEEKYQQPSHFLKNEVELLKSDILQLKAKLESSCQTPRGELTNDMKIGKLGLEPDLEQEHGPHLKTHADLHSEVKSEPQPEVEPAPQSETDPEIEPEPQREKEPESQEKELEFPEKEPELPEKESKMPAKEPELREKESKLPEKEPDLQTKTESESQPETHPKSDHHHHHHHPHFPSDDDNDTEEENDGYDAGNQMGSKDKALVPSDTQNSNKTQPLINSNLPCDDSDLCDPMEGSGLFPLSINEELQGIPIDDPEETPKDCIQFPRPTCPEGAPICYTNDRCPIPVCCFEI